MTTGIELIAAALRGKEVAAVRAVACVAVFGFFASSAMAVPVGFRIAKRAPVGNLGCRESSPPMEFLAARGNSVNREHGPKAQYALDMKVRVRPLGRDGSGSISIYGEVGGEPATTVEVRRRREDGRWVVHWSSIDLVEGVSTGTVDASGSVVETVNFLPFGTVRRGRNQLRFRVECSGMAPVASVKVMGSTALRETEQAPAHLRLLTPEAGLDPEAGMALPVPFQIANTGDIPAVDVEVHLVAQKSRAQLVGRTSYVFSTLSGKQSGEFLVVPRRPGPFALELVATSGNSNQPAVGLRGSAGKRGRSGGAVASPWLAVAGLTAAGALALILWGRWRSRAEHP